jgi:hypothetical protein
MAIIHFYNNNFDDKWATLGDFFTNSSGHPGHTTAAETDNAALIES